MLENYRDIPNNFQEQPSIKNLIYVCVQTIYKKYTERNEYNIVLICIKSKDISFVVCTSRVILVISKIVVENLHCIKVYSYIAYHLESLSPLVFLSASEMYNLYGT